MYNGSILLYKCMYVSSIDNETKFLNHALTYNIYKMTTQTIKAKRFSSKDGLDNIIAIDSGNDTVTWYRENRDADKFTVRKEVFEGISKNHKFDKDIEVVNPNPTAPAEEAPKETKESVTATTATNTSEQ
jgi:hypothetical protein